MNMIYRNWKNNINSDIMVIRTGSIRTELDKIIIQFCIGDISYPEARQKMDDIVDGAVSNTSKSNKFTRQCQDQCCL